MHPMLMDVRRLLFLGDSLTDGAAWPDWVVETLVGQGMPRPRLHNAGVAGDTAARMRARYRADVLARHPDLVVMHGGTNDANRGVPVADYARDMAAMVRGIRAAGARVLVLTPPAMRDAERDARLRLLIPLVLDIAARHGCSVADAHGASAPPRRAGPSSGARMASTTVLTAGARWRAASWTRWAARRRWPR